MRILGANRPSDLCALVLRTIRSSVPRADTSACSRSVRFYAEDVRVKNKIIRETRKKALQFKNDDIDLEDIQGELDARAKFISVPLDRMVEDKEISSYETTVDESCYDTFLEDETMSVIIRYLSRGYIREVVIDIGRSALSSN